MLADRTIKFSLLGIKLYFYGNDLYCFCHPIWPPCIPLIPLLSSPSSFVVDHTDSFLDLLQTSVVIVKR